MSQKGQKMLGKNSHGGKKAHMALFCDSNSK